MKCKTISGRAADAYPGPQDIARTIAETSSIRGRYKTSIFREIKPHFWGNKTSILGAIVFHFRGGNKTPGVKRQTSRTRTKLSSKGYEAFVYWLVIKYRTKKAAILYEVYAQALYIDRRQVAAKIRQKQQFFSTTNKRHPEGEQTRRVLKHLLEALEVRQQTSRRPLTAAATSCRRVGIVGRCTTRKRPHHEPAHEG